MRKHENHYTAVHSKDSNPTEEAKLAGLTGDICTEIERRRLTYARNLEYYRLYGMPWLEVAARRLPILTYPEKVMQLTFISCIGLRMNGEYVDYVQLQELSEEMPLTQSMLQKRLIQGRDLMEKVTAFRLWKLHVSLNYRVSKRRRPAPTGQSGDPPVFKEKDQVPEEPLEINDLITDIPAIRSHSTVLSRDVKLKWTPAELSLLALDTTATHRQVYENYVKECQKSMFPIRTFVSFSKKRRQYLKEN